MRSSICDEVMKMNIQKTCENAKCIVCNWSTPVLYRLEGDSYSLCGNCFCQMLVDNDFGVVKKEV